MSEAGMTHVGMMKLRQLRSGELPGEEANAVRAHADGCPDCLGKLQGLEDEQAQFEAAISFDRFAAGVERAARPRRVQPARRWMAPALAAAASVLLVVSAGRALWPTSGPGPGPGPGPGLNTIKGSAEIALKIASPGGESQRDAPETAPALLSPGERVRVGYRALHHRYVTVISIDQQGLVTPIYPEQGESLPAFGGNAMVYLPESLEFTGSGAERLIVILSDEPLQSHAALAAARRAFRDAQGDLARMGPLAVPGEQFARMVQKP
jgi:putative zinc finger protein